MQEMIETQYRCSLMTDTGTGWPQNRTLAAQPYWSLSLQDEDMQPRDEDDAEAIGVAPVRNQSSLVPP